TNTTYQHDDFGNVISVSGPWAAGAVNYEYNALGKVLHRQTYNMSNPSASYVENSYDMLGRLTAVNHYSSAGSEFLYSFTYDSALPDTSSCPQPTGSANQA